MVVYKGFPGKMRKDTYTPQILKLQVLMVYLLIPGIIGAIFASNLKYLPLGLIAGFFLTTIPFCLRALKESIVLAIVSPFFLLARASALGLGAFAGLFQIRSGKEGK